MWFDSWSDLGRLLVVAPLAYGALVAVLRVSGAHAGGRRRWTRVAAVVLETDGSPSVLPAVPDLTEQGS